TPRSAEPDMRASILDPPLRLMSKPAICSLAARTDCDQPRAWRRRRTCGPTLFLKRMSICFSALVGFRLRSFEAHARRAFDLTKLDQLSGGASWQRRGHFIAKFRDRFQVVHRVEKTVEGFAGESENLV